MVSIKVSECLQFWQKALQRTGTDYCICMFASHYENNCIPAQFSTISKNISSSVWNKWLNVSYWQARKADLWRALFFWDVPCYTSLFNFLPVFDNRKGTQWLYTLRMQTENWKGIKKLQSYHQDIILILKRQSIYRGNSRNHQNSKDENLNKPKIEFRRNPIVASH